MELTTDHYLKWTEHASVLSNEPFSDQWLGIGDTFGRYPEQNLGVSPQLLESDSLWMAGQLSHPDPTGPSMSRRDSFREASIPVEQLKGEILWPRGQLDGSTQGQTPPHLHRNISQSREGEIAEHRGSLFSSTGSTMDKQHSPAPPNPPKRKCGRPRLYSSSTDEHNHGVSLSTVSVSRKSHLEKNRVAAEKCRQRRKEYTTRLFSRRNGALLQERNSEGR